MVQLLTGQLLLPPDPDLSLGWDRCFWTQSSMLKERRKAVQLLISLAITTMEIKKPLQLSRRQSLITSILTSNLILICQPSIVLHLFRMELEPTINGRNRNQLVLISWLLSIQNTQWRTTVNITGSIMLRSTRKRCFRLRMQHLTHITIGLKAVPSLIWEGLLSLLLHWCKVPSITLYLYLDERILAPIREE